MERNKKVLVVGAGVAGPLVALAMKKAGLDVRVVDDRAPGAVSTQGAWLTVAANGLDAMRTLGVADAVMARGFPSEAIELANARGRVLGAVPLGARRADGTMTHTVRRSDLCEVLHDAALAVGVPIAHQRRLVRIEERPDGMTAHFTEGPPEHADVLVGCDGIWSTVRGHLDPSAPAPRYGGLGDVGGFTPSTSLSSEVRAQLLPGTYRMIFGRRAFFGFTVTPAGDAWWFANPVWPVPRDREALRSASDEARRAELIALFVGDEGPMAELIEHAVGEVVVTHQYDMPRVPVWTRGRVVIVGDAAHAAKASSGQGVSMAAEDAVELARCLRDLSIDDALRAYERVRRVRTERVVAFGDRNANGKALGPVGAFFRDAMMPFILRRIAAGYDQSTGWLFAHHIDWDAPVTP
jgi:2-polyprenyl-6-methoxyphenol hydroxylase-like FAD-dependent oxidoreductase